MKLHGKVALVTGAGTLKKAFSTADQVGNGAACAIVFAREGALVVCTDRSLAAAQETAEAIRAAGGQAVARELDVTDTAQVDAVTAALMREHGRIDVLHNNVGVEVQGDLLAVDDADWDRVMAINLRGAMATSRAVLPHMRRQRAGSIINVSSTASLKWSPMQFLSYSTSKAGLNHMTRVIARQYAADQVRCNSIVPGMIRTPHADALYQSAEQAAEGHRFRDSRCPMGRQGTPWDVANAALFLASDDSAYVTGLLMVVDGGASL
ncbi:SDR family oxidoreductase [Verticiella sediminum]|uniref:SDR family oxidoreductase n=1 Tax=Verticiella sediminum TaxID=1247510 RepID=A0A556AXL1_9BURK|nr:SDR family NAD(P)-dependent oxidoreductase [Verticiella sediminum]TSH97670.1 SDR family oxidoreductase [Verticiella sediminum]